MIRAAPLALVIGAASLSGCAAAIGPVVAQVGAGIAGAKAIYDVAGMITGASSDVIKAACGEWRITRASAAAHISDGAVPLGNAAQAADTMPWADAACDPAMPAPADPVAAAVWIAVVAGRVDQLTRGAAP